MEEDSAEAQHQPQARLDTEAAAAASSAGEGAPCPPSVKIFDAVVVKQPYEGDNRLAWRGPGSPSANNETKPRRSASGDPCAGRVVAHRRAGGAPKEESRNHDLRCVGRPSHRRAGGAPKAEEQQSWRWKIWWERAGAACTVPPAWSSYRKDNDRYRWRWRKWTEDSLRYGDGSNIKWIGECA